jgi:hypothetical protein
MGPRANADSLNDVSALDVSRRAASFYDKSLAQLHTRVDPDAPGSVHCLRHTEMRAASRSMSTILEHWNRTQAGWQTCSHFPDDLVYNPGWQNPPFVVNYFGCP